MLNKPQAVLQQLLPPPIFEWLYRRSTTAYYAWRGMTDWWYYYRPRRNIGDRKMINNIRSVLPYTMVGRKGLITTYALVCDIEWMKIKGCLVECGVARGGSATLMMLASRALGGNRNLFLFDSFEGLPEPTEEDGVLRNPRSKDRASDDLTAGHCLGTVPEVRQLLESFGFPMQNIHLVKGWFQNTLPTWKTHLGRESIALLRLDGDWYESTKCCLENLYDCVVFGGVVIVDDYELVGCKKATDEFLTGRGISPKITLDGRGGGYFVKLR